MEYVIDNGISDSDNSWGGGGFSQVLYDVIQASQSVGHIFVAASGNNRANTDIWEHYPPSYNLPNIISVAATDNDDELAHFSNFGVATIDVGAPGVSILSTVLGSNHSYYNGTSMATPHVTGVIALAMSRRPDWTWQQVRDRLLSTTRPVDSLLGRTVFGGVVSALNIGDCNVNGSADSCDIADSISLDVNGNGVPDECDVILFVDANATGNADGSGWTDAFDDLQDALGFAAAPANGVTEIWVAEGRYTPDRGTGSKDATFRIASGTREYGGFPSGATTLGQRDPTLHAPITTIS